MMKRDNRVMVVLFALACALACCSPSTPTPDAGAVPEPAVSIAPTVKKLSARERGIALYDAEQARIRVIRAQAPPPKVGPLTAIAPYALTAEEVNACTTPAGEWRCKQSKPMVMAASGARPPRIPASWLVSAWALDPGNASGNASDGNTCTTYPASPCLHAYEIALRLGSVPPLWSWTPQQATTITLYSTQPSNGETDGIDYEPQIVNGNQVNFVGVLNATTQLATGTLTVTQAFNRSLNHNLQITVSSGGGSLIQGDLCLNTSVVSQAIVDTSGTPINIGVPMSGTESSAALPTEQTWVTGNTYFCYAEAGVNFVKIAPLMSDNAVTPPLITQITGLDPTSAGTGTYGPLSVNGSALVTDSWINRTVNGVSPGTSPGLRFTNIFFANGFHLSGPPFPYGTTVANVEPNGNPQNTPLLTVFGGLDETGSATPIYDFAGGTWVDYDFYLTDSQNESWTGENFYGCLGFFTNKAIKVANSYMMPTASGACSTNAIVWGQGAVDLEGFSRWSYRGATAVNTFLNVAAGGLLQVNNRSTTACSHSNAAPDVVSCGQNLNPTNLDAAQGSGASPNIGFGGLAYLPGGASFSSVQ